MKVLYLLLSIILGVLGISIIDNNGNIELAIGVIMLIVSFNAWINLWRKTE